MDSRLEQAARIAKNSLHANRILLRAWDRAEDRTLRWQAFAVGVCGALALFRPGVGLVCMVALGVLTVTTIRASRRDTKVIERAIEGGHDHD